MRCTTEKCKTRFKVGQVRRMHRHHGGNSQHQKNSIRTRSPRVRNSLIKIMRIPQSRSHDSPTKIKVLAHPGLPAKGLAGRKGLSGSQGNHLQQPRMLLSTNWKSENSIVIPNPGPRSVAEAGPAKDVSRHSSQPVCSVISTGSTRGRPAAFHAVNYSAPGWISIYAAA